MSASLSFQLHAVGLGLLAMEARGWGHYFLAFGAVLLI